MPVWKPTVKNSWGKEAMQAAVTPGATVATKGGAAASGNSQASTISQEITQSMTTTVTATNHSSVVIIQEQNANQKAIGVMKNVTIAPLLG